MYYIGVEIGGTKQQVCVGTSGGQIEETRWVKLGSATTATNILLWIRGTIEDLRRSYDIAAIGVGFGGPIDPATETIICSCQIPGWEGFTLGNWFRETFGVPAVVRNDTVTGGLGELYLGAGKGSTRFFYTNIGTGIGGGSYWPGGYGASSMGYVWVPDWESDIPGKATRLEFLCAGPSIEKRLNTPGYVPEGSYLSALPKPLTCSHLGDGVRAGDAFCCAELDRVAQTFSYGLADMLALSFPDRIVVGGGVAKLGDILFDRLRKFTEASAFVADVGHIDIRPGLLEDEAVLAGALLLAENPRLHL
ncbi:MAG: ROK family protein [Oscillospiraceae bacterium]|nr:ROK family protein [Oscillospiraceae bacterium]